MATDVGNQPALERQKASISVEGERSLGVQIAAVIIRHEGFAAYRRPLDRAAKTPGRPGDNAVLRIRPVARAEIAADVVGDHEDLLFRYAHDPWRCRA